MVLKFGLSFLQVSCLVALFVLALFNFFRGLGDLRSILSRDVLQLILLKLCEFFLILIDLFIQLQVILILPVKVDFHRIPFLSVSYSELSLQVFDLFSIFMLIVLVSNLPP